MMILNNLKNALRKKKLYFTIKYSEENVKNILFLQQNYVIAGFTVTKTKRRFIIVFLRYCNNFDASITSFCVSSSKLSNYQNQITLPNFNTSNFIITNSVKENKKPKFCIKFR
jgi:ribosomal protein S8